MFLFDYGDNITSYQADPISSELAGRAVLSGCLCLNKQEYLTILTLHFIQKYFIIPRVAPYGNLDFDIKQRRQRITD